MTSEIKLSDYLLKTVSADKWKRIGPVKRTGVLVPLFSVYSKKSLGIGEIDDLRLVVDWCNKTGNSIIQLLPLNNLGAIFCPYDSLSSFALEPAYSALRLFSSAARNPVKKKIENLKKAFPAGKFHLDYRIKKEKINLLWEIFELESSLEYSEFQQFKQDNSYWLDDFGLFIALKDYHQGKAWYEWEDKYKNRQHSSLELFRKEHAKEIMFWMWLQWQLYRQFKDVKAYAQAKKVLIKGDLPILVSRDSADVWSHPEFFKLDFASGAPPDMYCSKGQRWGMPTYNWETIARDNYRYLKEKLKYAQNFYDILRIDHVVGLFRIWSIPYNEPMENQGLHGAFDPADEQKWGQHGTNLLSVILDNTDMLLCAEDLGVIPKACTEALEKLGMPGNDVQRWVKDWKRKHDFLLSQEYRALSVAMLSTHDTTNWRAWWENEAGTVDEGLVKRRCSDHRNISYDRIKDRLFELANSRYGRLRWKNSISSIEALVEALGKKKEEVRDFIDMYENSFNEKEKLWGKLNIRGPVREKAGPGIIAAALKITLGSSAVFCIETIIDWLFLADIFKGDPYQYRINTPGTISPKNWSLVIPLSLEELLQHKVCADIKNLITSSGR